MTGNPIQMAELTHQERLQPSLLDRLTDTAPDSRSESRDHRILSMRRLREAVLRDLAWLLNTGQLKTTEDLERYPEVEKSVVNYGMPDITGLSFAGTDTASLEKAVRDSIVNFEPRISPNSVHVTVVKDDQKMSRNSLVFSIEGQLWAEPTPITLYLKTEVDLETGSISVADA
jgi:type VI secretion system protein ImpF